jgi:hypothetical protein
MKQKRFTATILCRHILAMHTGIGGHTVTKVEEEILKSN